MKHFVGFVLWISCSLLWTTTTTTNGLVVVVKPPKVRSSSSSSKMWMAKQEEEEIEKLRESASRLRQEAQELELSLTNEKKNKQPKSSSMMQQQEQEKVVTYNSMDDSKWILTYRFASDPINSNDNDNEEDKVPLTFYSGKVTVLFRSDGYTDLISSTAKDIQFIKFWGWDPEVSREDGNTYLLFSADVQLPSSNNEKTRFYFNAQIETSDDQGIISLTDGKVTVKRDLNPGGVKRWGFFRTEGILAQFRYCGDFLCKPTS